MQELSDKHTDLTSDSSAVTPSWQRRFSPATFNVLPVLPAGCSLKGAQANDATVLSHCSIDSDSFDIEENSEGIAGAYGFPWYFDIQRCKSEAHSLKWCDVGDDFGRRLTKLHEMGLTDLAFHIVHVERIVGQIEYVMHSFDIWTEQAATDIINIIYNIDSEDERLGVSMSFLFGGSTCVPID